MSKEKIIYEFMKYKMSHFNPCHAEHSYIFTFSKQAFNELSDFCNRS